jgi:hypothetical protein
VRLTLVRGYRPKYFGLRELVSADVYMTRGDAAWELLDPRVLVAGDKLREKFGPVTVNNWHRGGTYSQSGFRDPVTGVGARLSQHKRGAALDCKFRDTTPQAVYAYLLEHPDEFPEITVLEDIAATPSWLHVDVRAADWDGIRVVKP